MLIGDLDNHLGIAGVVGLLFVLIAVPYMRGFVRAWREDRARIVEWVDGSGTAWGGFFICGGVMDPEELIVFRRAVDDYRRHHEWPPAKSAHFLLTKGKLVEL